MFRCDSSRIKKSNRGRHTGGVAFYVRDDIAISSEIILSYSTDAIQLLCLHSKVENLILACIYRQPDGRAHKHPSTHLDLKKALGRLVTVVEGINPSPDIVFGEDFNIIWAGQQECLVQRLH